MSKIDLKQRRRQRFEKVFRRLRDELVHKMKVACMPPDALEWFSRNIDFNVLGGKMNRGISVVRSVEILKGRALTEDEHFKATVLGWCIELVQAFFLISDDMMDMSIMRRGHPCWYRIEGVGNIAINDAIMIESTAYHLLRKYFRHEPYYGHIMDLFHETTLQTEMGQLVDLVTSAEDCVDLRRFSHEKHAFMAQYKTGYYTFYLPVALALHFCGVPEAYAVNGQTVRPFDVALSIMKPLGEYYQVQDDYLDYAGKPEQMGKIGTDIVENKCTWCINVALEVATPEQRAVLEANYGRKDAAMEANVKEVYDAIGLGERYRAYEEGARELIEKLIADVPEPKMRVQGVLRRKIFTEFLNDIYKRTK